MRDSIIRGAIVTVMLLAFAHPALAQALKGPVSDKPLTEKWAPSKWGANDRAGSANHTKTPRTSSEGAGHGQAEQVAHDGEVLPP